MFSHNQSNKKYRNFLLESLKNEWEVLVSKMFDDLTKIGQQQLGVLREIDFNAERG